MNTNFFGSLWTSQAVLPGMRLRKTGIIVNISSVAGQTAGPSYGLYSATKFALEGMTEGLASEVADFGIKVIIVQPGAFRTNFLSAFEMCAKGISDTYRNTAVERMVQTFHQVNGTQPGDPSKAADRLFEVISDDRVLISKIEGNLLRLPLGSDSHGVLKARLNKSREQLELTEAIALDTEYMDIG
jgi:NAD(P)-dependent dehydrogenase (short-subunit alcohol dehydrogenase family)